MKYFEFGQEHPELMVMLHGGGTSYRGMLPTAQVMAKVYHVVLVAYDGFNPDEPETEFRSPMDEAKRLGDHLAERYGGKIDILYGISYGCRILMEVLADPRLTVTTTIADGMGLKDYPNIRSKWGKDVYRILYGKATWQSWKNQDYFFLGRKTDFTLFEKTDAHLWYGIRGSVDQKLSQNLSKLCEKGYPFTEKIFTDLGHGGLAGEQPERFSREVQAAHRASLEKEGIA